MSETKYKIIYPNILIYTYCYVVTVVTYEISDYLFGM